MNPVIRAMLMTNQKASDSGPVAPGIRDLRIIATGIIPAIRQFIEVSSVTKDLASARG